MSTQMNIDNTSSVEYSNLHSKQIVYILIFGIILFFIHMQYRLFLCKQFSWTSFSILVITLTTSFIYIIIRFLQQKIVRVNSFSPFYTGEKVGDYVIKGSLKTDLIILLIGLIIFLVAIIVMGFKNHTSYYFGCTQPSFPWATTSILFTTLVILSLKALLKYV